MKIISGKRMCRVLKLSDNNMMLSLFAFPRRILLAALLAVVVSVSDGRAGEEAPLRPNVIVILTDDQGYGDLSCHGNRVLKTPNLDKLHAESVRLTDFHVTPLCTPSRGQLMSGVDCLRNGAMNVSSGRALLRRGVPTLADLFSALGYWTGLFGKWHLGDNYPYRPVDRGFRESLWFPSSHIGSAPDAWNNSYFDDTYIHNGERKAYRGYCTDVFFAEAMSWMKDCADRKQPFLAYIATNAPHIPLHVPAQYRGLYAGQKDHLARFYGTIANIDDNIGRLDTFLANNGLKENTILVFLTDNGGTVGVPAFNAGMRGAKFDLYDGGHRVPCFIRWPAGRLRAPADVAELTQAQDILPTLIELAGQPLPRDLRIDGLSLVPLLRAAAAGDPRAAAIAERKLVVQVSRIDTPRPQKGDACVLWKRWRLVHDRELYDLAVDPAQKTNVIAQFPDIAAALRSRYDAWWTELAPRVNDHEAIVLGSDKEPSVTLTPVDWEDVFLDQSLQIREGLRRNGVWNVEIVAAGDYEIALRRWPADADVPIRSAMPAHKHFDGVYPSGKALPVASARLRIADFDKSQPVVDADKAIKFTVPLAVGRTKLQTWFSDAEGAEICGAYYVTVRRAKGGQ